MRMEMRRLAIEILREDEMGTPLEDAMRKDRASQLHGRILMPPCLTEARGSGAGHMWCGFYDQIILLKPARLPEQHGIGLSVAICTANCWHHVVTLTPQGAQYVANGLHKAHPKAGLIVFVALYKRAYVAHAQAVKTAHTIEAAAECQYTQGQNIENHTPKGVIFIISVCLLLLSHDCCRQHA
jgi:hypothetical protein